jgi:lysophospholipase L1-like esterase
MWSKNVAQKGMKYINSKYLACMNQKRRTFLKSGLALGAFGIETDNSWNEEIKTIVFQGDSITDGNRTRNQDWNHLMGHGYANNVASKLWLKYPEKQLTIYNRGVSGNTITDLQNRWQEDTLALKPDLISILVGVNDLEAYLKGSQADAAPNFEQHYRNLLTQTKAALPNVKLALWEPFVLPVGRVKDKFEEYQKELKPRQQIVKKLAQEFGALHVPFQELFTKATQKAAPNYWIWDGIHPMPAGHEMMALEWLRIVGM